MMTSRTSLFAAWLLVAAAGGQTAAERIEARLQQVVEENALPGLAVGIVRGDELVYARGFGFADRKSKEPATPKTLYRIGSVTKVFTATLLVALRDSGRLGLDDALSRYLPGNVPVPSDPRGAPEITLRHLATHASGLPRVPVTLDSGKEDPYDNFSRQALLASLKKTRLDYPTGEKYSYSNLGFALLGRALERATGETYEELLDRILFEPLGMTSSAVTLGPKRSHLLATPYAKSDTQKETADWNLGSIAPAGGIASSVEDMAKFVSLHLKAGTLNKLVLPGGSLMEMQTPQRLTGNWKGAVGLGWHVQPSTLGGDIVWHNGGMDGFRSYVGLVRRKNIGVILLTNCGKSLDELGQWLLQEAQEVYGEEVKKSPSPEIERVARDLAGHIVAEPADSLAELFHPIFLESIPLPKLKALFGSLHQQHGSCRVGQLHAGDKPRSGVITLSCKDGKTVRCHVMTAPGSPPRIIYLLFP